MNVIVVYDKTKTNILLYKRTKESYMGKYSFFGCSIEYDEHLNETYMNYMKILELVKIIRTILCNFK